MEPFKLGNTRRALAGAVVLLALAPAGAGAASSATALPLPPLPRLPDPLPQIPLDTADLGLEYVTHYQVPNGGGELVKRFTSTLGATRALNVDGQGADDLFATLSLQPDSSLKLTIRRPEGATGALPVSVEAIANDPTQGNVLPRDKVAFGYDGRPTTAPGTWISTIVAGSKDDATSVDVTTATTGAGASLRTLGTLFNGDALKPQLLLGGSIYYYHVPPKSSLGMTLSTGAAELRAGASTPVTASADVEIGQAKSKRVTAVIHRMPTSLRIRRDVAAKTVRYWATSEALDLDMKLVEAGGKTYTLDVDQVPTDVGVTSTSSRTSVQVGSGAIGHATVGVSSGPLQLLDVDHPFVRVAPGSTAVRLDGVQQAVIDTVDGIGAEVQLAAGMSKKFRVLAELAGKTVDGTVSSLPAHFRAAYTPSAGRVSYNGYDTAIGSSDVALLSPTPLFGRVTRVFSHMESLPTSVTVTYKKSATGTGAGFTATPRVGLIEADLRGTQGWIDEIRPGLPDGQYGGSLRDVPDEQYRAFIRLRDVTSGELSQIDGKLKATLRTAPAGTDYQDINLIGRLNRDGDAVTEDTTINGFVQDLPPVATIEEAEQSITFTGNRAIPYATVSARDLPGGTLHGEIHNLDATLTNLPATFTVDYGKTRQGLSAPSGSFGTIEFSAWDDTAAPAAPDFDNYVVLDRRDGSLRVRGRVHGIQKAVVDQSQLQLAFGAAQAQLEFQLHDGTSADPMDMTAGLLPRDGGQLIPTRVNLTLTAPEGGAHMIWDANAVSKLYVTQFAKAMSIENLQIAMPAKVDVCVGTGEYVCDPHSLTTVDGHDLTNDAIVVVQGATAPLTVNGHLCLQHDDVGVHDDCPGQDGDDRYVVFDNLKLRNARFEAAKRGDYLKLHLDTDEYGLTADTLRIKTDHNVRLEAPSPIRSMDGPFTGVAYISPIGRAAESTYRSAATMTCSGLHADIADDPWDGRDRVIPTIWCGDV